MPRRCFISPALALVLPRSLPRRTLSLDDFDVIVFVMPALGNSLGKMPCSSSRNTDKSFVGGNTDRANIIARDSTSAAEQRQKPFRIGIVAAGYADGYPRHAPDGTPVLVDGVRTGIVGTVSMDMLAVDLTPCPQAGIGTPVELWGSEIKIDDVAAAAGTVGYELMCALAPRVPVVTQ